MLIEPNKPMKAIVHPTAISKLAPKYISADLSEISDSPIRCISVEKSRSILNQIPIHAATQPAAFCFKGKNQIQNQVKFI
jgi:hypothetical protein